MNLSMTDWITSVSNESCVTNEAALLSNYPSGERRLSDTSSIDTVSNRFASSLNVNDLNVSLNTLSIRAEGRWVRIHIPDIFWAIELHFLNIETPSYVPLTHSPLDTNVTPPNHDRIQITYSRHIQNDRRCAMIISSVYGNVAMIRNSIQIAQSGNNPCSCDLHMWVPIQVGVQPIIVSETSTSMNGFAGARQFQAAEERGLMEVFEARLVADPHLQFAHGGRADIRGKHNSLYNILSSYKFSMNVKFENSTIILRNNTVYGSFVTGAYMQTESMQVRFEAFQNMLGAYSSGRCGNRRFVLRSYQSKVCGDVELVMNYSSFFLKSTEWSIAIQPKPIYDRIDGPFKRLDISISNVIPQFNFKHTPHGLLGQSFDSDHMAVFGLTESFNTNPYHTRYMAEGAIEGHASDYEVTDKFSNDFVYSRFTRDGNTRSLQNLEGFIMNVLDD
jgi:hypothetical protein